LDESFARFDLGSFHPKCSSSIPHQTYKSFKDPIIVTNLARQDKKENFYVATGNLLSF